MEQYIYIILSQTQTKFARTIRFVGRQSYNHVAISLDDTFRRVYAYARPQHNAVLLGGLVQESLDRYTLGRSATVPIAVYRLPVTEGERRWIEAAIERMDWEHGYMYNLFSVLSYPVTRGFPVRKAFTCVEFAAYLLQHCGYLQDKQRYQYTPDDLAEEFRDYLVYEGDIRRCLPRSDWDGDYFAPFTPAMFYDSAKALCRITYRSCFHREA